jgi:hypothetical protein
MAQQYRYPNSASVSVDAIGTNGLPIPTSSILVAGEDPSGDLTPIATDANGHVQVDVNDIPLPPGAATAAKQDEQTALLTTIDADTGSISTSSSATAASVDSIDTKTPALVAGRVPVDGSGVTQPISAAALPLPAGAATEATLASLNGKVVAVDTGAVVVSSSALPSGAATEASLASVDAKLGSLGQKAMAGSAPVVIASDQSTIPVSVASVPLPTGAATEATLSALNAKVTAVDTGAVVVSSSALPTGAATEATLSALNAKVVSDYGASSGAVRTAAQVGNASGVADFGAGASGAQTLRVVSANESNPKAGRSYVTSVRKDYTAGSVTTGAWVELIASTSAIANLIEIFDSSGQTLELGVGAAAAEARVCLIFPGGNGQIPLQIASGSRVSVRAVSATASVGELDINLYS